MLSKIMGMLGKLIKKKVKGKMISIIAKIGPTVALIVLIIILAAFYYLYGAIISIAESIKNFFFKSNPAMTEEEYKVWVNDPEKIYDSLKHNDELELGTENLFFMDDETLIRIFEAIHDYNKRRTNSKEITYQYRVEYSNTGEFYEINNLTGELTIPEETVAEDLDSDTDDEEPETIITIAYMEDTITLYRSAVESEKNADGQDIFDIRWQPIVALAACVIQDKYSEWGSHGNALSYEKDYYEQNMENYYLTDQEIDDIINIFYFKADYYYDAIENPKNRYKFSSFYDASGSMSAYDLEISLNGSEDSYSRTTIYLPALAPKSIHNSFINYTYNYQNLGNNLYQCVERTYNLIPEAFVTSCQAIAENFDMNTYVSILGQLPASEDLCVYYSDVIKSMAQKYEIATYTDRDKDRCSAIGIYFYNGAGGGSSGGMGSVEWSTDTYSIPLYASDGWNNIFVTPAPWIMNEDGTYGLYELYADTLKSLSVSDNLSAEQIRYILDNYAAFEKARQKCPVMNTPRARMDLARCLYDYQEETQTSVLGLLAIMRQEGGFTSVIARNGWNFFNIKGRNGDATTSYVNSSGLVVNTPFKDYKLTYQGRIYPYATDAVNAFELQVNSISSWYWKSEKHDQNSYYLMIWKYYNYTDYTTISHSYCPPWDDTAMPYSRDSYYLNANGDKVMFWVSATTNNRGWTNQCAYYRAQLEVEAAKADSTWEAPNSITLSEEVLTGIGINGNIRYRE